MDEQLPGSIPSEEWPAAAAAMTAELGVLTAALSGVWSASLVRTTVFLGVLSASGVALGFVAQAGVQTTDFVALAVVVLLVVFFLGVTTFARLVQLQREAVVYITGQNRIRHFFAQNAPAVRPHYVLPVHDDLAALYRSAGTGMRRRPPRYPLLGMVAQTQGIVGVVTGAVAAAIAGLALNGTNPLVSWVAALGGLVVTVAILFTYWRRSLAEIQGAIKPLSSTPPDEVGAPF